ncbi:MAG TPA: hypothetical protein VJR95_12205 [Rhodanobacter sp.]|nr:hypothetical protein [Rhodanobacter sp.]
MIELEIQALALQREGLLIEVGRLAAANDFTLLRQRLTQDTHGILLSMVVRGSWFKKRALRLALESCDRLVSFELVPAVEDGTRAHFAAASKVTSGYVPPSAPPPEPASAPEHDAVPAPIASAEAEVAIAAPPQSVPETETFEALVVRRSAPPPAAPELEPKPFVELPELAADEAAVGRALAALEQEYPRILPRLQALDRGVQPGARDATLQLAGRRVGAWLFAREYSLDTGLALDTALPALAVPALHAFADVELQDGRLHIRHSALCSGDGHSGCGFYGGFLEGLLGPALARRSLAVFPVCCRSFGADECVLAVSD